MKNIKEGLSVAGLAGKQVRIFVDFIKTIDPQMTRIDATKIAINVIAALPEVIAKDPSAYCAVRETAKKLRDLRNRDQQPRTNNQ